MTVLRGPNGSSPAPPRAGLPRDAGELGVLVERLVRDLDPDARVEWTTEPRTVMAILVLGDTRVGAGVPDDRPVAAAALQIVDALQDAVIEHYGGRALPPCPGHPHPAVLRPDGDSVVWRCPRLDRPVAD
jgi:hypothetical protein